MKKLILLASAIAVSGISLISISAKADTLYRYEGAGSYKNKVSVNKLY